MVVTVHDLVRDPELGTRLVCDGAATPSSLVWAHSSDLSDPTPFLEPGQMLLTTGRQFSDYATQSDYETYVERLALRGIPAIGFGTELVRSGTPDELISACLRHKIALLEIPYGTPFIAIVKRIADDQTLKARLRLEQAFDAQETLVRSALTDDGIAVTLTQGSELLQTPVWVFDADAGILGSSEGAPSAPPPQVTKSVQQLLHRGQRAARVDKDDQFAWKTRTLGRSGQLIGALVTIEAEAAASPNANAAAIDDSILMMLTALIEMNVEHMEDQRRGTRDLMAQYLHLLRVGRIDFVRGSLEAVRLTLPKPPLRVVAVPIDEVTPAVRDSVDRLASRHPGRMFAAADDTHLFALADPVLVSEIQRVLQGARGGVSEDCDWDLLSDGILQAVRSAARAPAGEFLRFHRFVEGNVLGLLSTSQVAAIARTRLRDKLGTSSGRRDLTEASVWLRHHGKWEPASRELGVPRQVLKARIGQFGRDLDLDLETFESRAELWALLVAIEH